ncbi:LeuD/DmdB family oxidoreductase small subunit [Candidatus Roseilinea sp. NK_OTU-006]|jgi:3-isopropylmalate/(R)-2-methylmalate dehydratase small subunit|uniref:LeuD/DmdB family oxidoreductase small subunit n=1 Tax=Candidatus Roseilinea sp. NK_OTU-006 TaxID=2704250 RepID=UPI00145E33EB|nr:3-isopropylmalate dehydratase [Candidatus Roseilinea sp. NK_OTU-006]
MHFTGRCWVYGDDVNTDVIFPGKYTYTLTDINQFAAHALEDLDPDFAKQVQPGDIIVGGKNFGCGSSREQAAVCLKMCGVRVIIAKSFARIFFRNCINNGVLPIVCPEAVDVLHKGDRIRVDLAQNMIYIEEQSARDDGANEPDAHRSFSFPPLSASVMAIIEAGGLIPMLRRKLGTEHLPMPEIKFAAE